MNTSDLQKTVSIDESQIKTNEYVPTLEPGPVGLSKLETHIHRIEQIFFNHKYKPTRLLITGLICKIRIEDFKLAVAQLSKEDQAHIQELVVI